VVLTVVKGADTRVSGAHLESGFRVLKSEQTAVDYARMLESVLIVQTEIFGARIVVKVQQQYLWEVFVGRGAVAHRCVMAAQRLSA